ncbi:hypothetical protein GUITHDRAFT_158685 [Guillardia theta CCMP2712]|uniref:Anaphase-promoting complex subunit 10 n=1 Tax=Guillardia theta (strain CCMP2712) TaxID=905079 RepID=L1IKK6_GUITC|nr:hypothetical protein GUITHDRAFT_158685 [Guillardia theta CCMP2712]EKX36320.1 hypothetical protein GUITHDRAFT_158685 [Guillardia theta CCMP2712]|eukprot:XP_005823300.1 hypothetical protein GUITHDRAFT_158685 [Guillardia theta CCMP2712]
MAMMRRHSVAGGDAVWTLSTAKPGNGVEQLRDNNTDTYWQSDGPQPHLVNIQFHKKVSIKEIAMYCDFKLDESYTPSKISIRAGTHFHDLQDVKEINLEEPCGWLTVAMNSLRAFMIQIAVLANHENGRDSHIRQIKIYGPRLEGLEVGSSSFSTPEFSSYSSIR